MQGSSEGGALFSVVWGVLATGFGVIVAADIRGAAGRLLTFSQRSVLFGATRRTPVRPGFFRAVAAVFALLGPVMLVTGVRELAQGDGAVTAGFPPIPLPIAGGMALFTAVAFWQLWRRDGMLRQEWARGAVVERSAAGVLTASLAGFVAALALGGPVFAMGAWLVGGLAGLVLLLGGSRTAPPGRSGGDGR
ncbi:hypothetical protein GCM10023329_55230 [Streptomyces sanyensis]|uniref:Integral membrane protein n=1 Tax=Streptomyces sanyensis TaxID=568869 RepID=A0ABP9BIP7_9ACTN